MKIEPQWLKDPALQTLLQTIEDAGGEARVAGGAVRDALFGIENKDIDVATTLTPQEVMFLLSFYDVYPTGIDHGTVTIGINGKHFEVTTLRRDVETDGRHAKVEFTNDWEVDAHRRDFTINALFCDRHGEIFDYVGGLKDIEDQELRFVGDPDQRIQEDALRILRYFRFLSKHNLAYSIEGIDACQRNRALLTNISAERKTVEMLKLLVYPNAVWALELMKDTGVLAQLLLFEDKRIGQYFINLLPLDPILRLVAISKEPLSLQERWKLSSHQGITIKALADWSSDGINLTRQDDEVVKQWKIDIYKMGSNIWRSKVFLWNAFWKVSFTDPPTRDEVFFKALDLSYTWNVPDFPINGDYLKSLGFKQGKGIGDILKRVEDAWIENSFDLTNTQIDKLIWQGISDEVKWMQIEQANKERT